MRANQGQGHGWVRVVNSNSSYLGVSAVSSLYSDQQEAWTRSVSRTASRAMTNMVPNKIMEILACRRACGCMGSRFIEVLGLQKDSLLLVPHRGCKCSFV